MGKWADAAFERLKQQEGNKHQENQVYALRRQQILAEAPRIWEILRNHLNAEVADFSKKRPGHLGSVSLGQDALALNSRDKEVEVSFNEHVPEVSYSVKKRHQYGGDPEVEESYTFAVFDDKVWLYQSGSHHNVFSVGEKILDELI